MIDNISDKDKRDWNEFINNDEKLPNKDLVYKKKKFIEIRSVDLHGFTLVEANQEVKKFINQSYKEGINKLIVVTGKGLHSKNKSDPYVSKDLSILKYSVPEFILNNKNLTKIIRDIQDADIKDGGSGAFYIYLKKNNN